MYARRIAISAASRIVMLLLLLGLTACAAAVTVAAPAPTTVESALLPTATQRAASILLQTPTISKGHSPEGATAPTLEPTQTNAASLASSGILMSPLSVRITAPVDGAVVSGSPVVLTGEADPETVISVNDDFLVVDSGRSFSLPLQLEEGSNVFEITASDLNGNQATVYLTVIYDPQP